MKIEELTKSGLQAIARAIDKTINADNPTGDKRLGFCLLIFEEEKPTRTRLNYVSNCERASMLLAMKEYIAKNEGMNMPETKAVQ